LIHWESFYRISTKNRITALNPMLGFWGNVLHNKEYFSSPWIQWHGRLPVWNGLQSRKGSFKTNSIAIWVARYTILHDTDRSTNGERSWLGLLKPQLMINWGPGIQEQVHAIFSKEFYGFWEAAPGLFSTLMKKECLLAKGYCVTLFLGLFL
jgi:hypothetical protein